MLFASWKTRAVNWRPIAERRYIRRGYLSAVLPICHDERTHPTSPYNRDGAIRNHAQHPPRKLMLGELSLVEEQIQIPALSLADNWVGHATFGFRWSSWV